MVIIWKLSRINYVHGVAQEYPDFVVYACIFKGSRDKYEMFLFIS